MVKSKKTIRIACLGTPSDYGTSLVPLLIHSLGYKISWVRPVLADLLIYGSFYDVTAPRLRWLPRPWRKRAGHWVDLVENELSKRKLPPVTLFHTAENLRHDHIKADYSISHDLNVQSNRHFRLPYWMEVIDWSHEGVIGNANPRFGSLLNLELMNRPLGNSFLERSRKAIFITSHMREPKLSSYLFLRECIAIDGMGPYFDENIKDHNKSRFLKREVLSKYAINLCPENGFYPGYVTEKVPDAFAAGCLPVTYVSPNISSDFNINAFINIATINKAEFKEVFLAKASFENYFKSYCDEALFKKTPSIHGLVDFVKKILNNI